MRSYLAPVLDELLEHGERPPVFLDVDDIESDTQRALGHTEEANRFERLERWYLPRVDRVLACSAADARTLTARHGLAQVSVVPNAVRPADPAPAADGAYELLLVGTLGYAPNAEAARWLAERILPLLGNVRLAIVGRNPPPEVLAFGTDPRITVAADVADVGPWYAAARVATVPVLRGGGTRIKLLEALAHARPVVATTVGAAGLPWEPPGDAVSIADAPVSFAAACRARCWMTLCALQRSAPGVASSFANTRASR